MIGVVVRIVALSALLLVGSPAVTAGQGWTRAPENPLITPAPSGSWDDLIVYAARVVRLIDGSAYRDGQGFYYMVYTASGTPGGSHRDATGLLRSTDLRSWQRVGSGPVLPRGNPGEIDAGDASAVTVIYDSGLFHMWYEGNSSLAGSDLVSLNYATSSDLTTWQKFSGNPILRPGPRGSADDEDVYSPIVIKSGSRWLMWYSGHDSRGRYGLMQATADAPQGPWTRASTEFLFYPDRPLFASDIWREDGQFFMFYFETHATFITAIKLATSADGLTWVPRGEVFHPGRAGAWDDSDIYWPHQVRVDGLWHTFYSGSGDGGNRVAIGVATSVERYSFVRGGDGAPGPPLSARATVDGRAITLRWSAPASGDPASTFVIEAGSTFGGTSRGVFEQPAAATATAAQGLADGEYFVRVKARNGSGVGPASNEVRFTIGQCAAPDAPHQLSATVVPVSGGANVTLQWQPSATGCAPTGYRVEAGSRQGAADLALLDITNARQSLSVFAPSGTYFVRVRAVTATTIGLPSADYRLVVP